MANPATSAAAYFSMEVALTSDVPTYAGGLGVLAGDTLRAAADLGQYLRSAYLPGGQPGQPDPLLPALAPYLADPPGATHP